MKILLLEDNESLLEIIKEIFEEKGIEVDCYTDGEEALFNSQNGYDCFILDINVPKIDGLTLLKNIRSVDEETPAIIISSNIELETIKTAYIAGCNDFLKKPFYIYELEAKIDLLYNKKHIVELLEGYSYDKLHDVLLDEKGSLIKLTRKEKRFLTFLLKTPNYDMSLEKIEQYVWEGEMNSLSSMRSLVKRLKTKLPQKSIVAQNYGYVLYTRK